MAVSRVIYDLGSNNGDDIPYYLMRADRVVAVEANPSLCRFIEARFREEVSSGRVIVENCVLTDDGAARDVPFYIHSKDPARSQFPRPDASEVDEFERVLLPSKPVLSLLKSHGEPFYVKIDIEHYDARILSSLFAGGVRPAFISAESHSIEVLALLIAQGQYRAFKMVDGSTVRRQYKQRQMSTPHGMKEYSFPRHSAGPFGDDIDGPWFTADNFFQLLAYEGLGWKDIHATNLIEPDPAIRPRLQRKLPRTLRLRLIRAYLAGRRVLKGAKV